MIEAVRRKKNAIYGFAYQCLIRRRRGGGGEAYVSENSSNTAPPS